MTKSIDRPIMTGDERADPDDDATLRDDVVLASLVERHREFLAFIEKRVGDRATAEDILSEAFLRSIDRRGAIRDDESAVAWFYRVLRNAIVDRHRRGGARTRGLERYAVELETTNAMPDDTKNAICRCVTGLAKTLKPEYANALSVVDVEGRSLSDLAAEEEITVNNAGVRLHRARAALRQRVSRSCGTCAVHGCLDCTCSSAPRTEETA